MIKIFKLVVIKILKFFKVFDKDRKLNFEIVFRLRSLYFNFHNIFSIKKKKLSDYMNIAGSDKGIKYIKMYNILPELIESKRPTILEIGVGGHSAKYSGGKSLQALMFFYRKGKIIGADIIDKSFLDRSNLKTVIIDQNNTNQLNKLGKIYKSFDLIIDDGSHFTRHQKRSFEVLFKYLSNGGVYIIEDMLTSYLKGWGGNPNLKKGNLVEFFKEISHAPNSEMLKKTFLKKLSNYKNIELIFFFKNAVLIKKRVKKHKIISSKILNQPLKKSDPRKKKEGYLVLS